MLGQLIEGQLAQPLNHSYIPNISQAWPDYTNPFYDAGLAVHGPVHDLHDGHHLA